MEKGFALFRSGFPQVDHADMGPGRSSDREHGIKVRVPQTGVRTRFAVGRDGRVTVWVFIISRILHCDFKSFSRHRTCYAWPPFNEATVPSGAQVQVPIARST